MTHLTSRTGGFMLGIGLLLGATAAQAQDSYIGITSGGSVTASDRIATDDLRDVTTTAQLDSDGTAVVANFSFDMQLPAKVKFAADGQSYRVRSGSLSIKASVPINANSADSQIDFKTFGNNGRLTINFNSYTASFDNPFDNLGEAPFYARVCVVEVGKKWAISHPSFDPYSNPMLAAFDANDYSSTEGKLSEASKAAAKSPDDGFGEEAYRACGANGTRGIGADEDYATQFGALADPSARASQTWHRLPSQNLTTFFWGGEVSLGYNRFSVIDRSTISTVGESRIGFDANGRIGVLFGAGAVLTFSGGYTRAYSAKPSIDLCGPPDLAGNSTCVNGEDGQPEKKDTGYFTLAGRMVIDRNDQGTPTIGIRPSVTYVLEDKDFQFELPVFFQSNGSGGLDAGIRFLYNSGSKDAGVGAFVGTIF